MATAVISTTYDDKYLWYIPLTVWAWNKIGYDVICFMPHLDADYDNNKKFDLLMKVEREQGLNFYCYEFESPKHKEATYCQVSRLMACCLNIDIHEQLVVSDIDMLFLSKDYIKPASWAIIDIYGADLVPPNQFPMCYLSGTVQTWRALLIERKTYQQWLDDTVGVIECQDFRGNQWSLDQGLIYKLLKESETVDYISHNRAKQGTQFSTLRYDRDDSFILDRLNPDTIDFHMNRPGYEDKNFQIILTILQYHYPQEDFGWLVSYNEEYKKLLS